MTSDHKQAVNLHDSARYPSNQPSRIATQTSSSQSGVLEKPQRPGLGERIVSVDETDLSIKWVSGTLSVTPKFNSLYMHATDEAFRLLSTTTTASADLKICQRLSGTLKYEYITRLSHRWQEGNLFFSGVAADEYSRHGSADGVARRGRLRLYRNVAQPVSAEPLQLYPSTSLSQ